MADEGHIHKVVDLFPSVFLQVSCGWILHQRKLRPDNKVDNLLVDAVRPVVEKNFDIIYWV